ncbi:MAG: glutamine-hydrolyzing GMP synthase [Chloroflexi bacterium]|nr:glutamine-hydrolyzing GMP synthase [Chloroflexota bacterium]MCY4247339.1 glutamine-hydrolyzing GMP synthase [Chloroflexota bacterium]
MDDIKRGGIAVIDYGSQTTQLIARRIRELGVYAEIFAHDAAPEAIERRQPAGYILSGGPSSVYAPGAPTLSPFVLEHGKPVLGICYGMQLLTAALGGTVAASASREYGPAQIQQRAHSRLLADTAAAQPVWMSHGDRIEELPDGFQTLAYTANSPYAAIGDVARHRYGLQFHPEVGHSPQGSQMLGNFVFGICGCQAKWSAAAFIDEAVARIQTQVGDERVLLALSGGVDSAVAGALIQRAIGKRLTCVFVDNGLLRQGEAAQVLRVFRKERGMRLIAVNAAEEFLQALAGITEPETKRKIIGAQFIDVFSRQARQLRGLRFLAQGTIYPDVIESAAAGKSARTIKSHHNVGGLPEDLDFDLVEPLRDCFKDEVRRAGEALGLPSSIVWRQPFPGPGLAIRCLGELSWQRLETLRRADAIFTGELVAAGLLRGETAQCFAVLLPVRSVGVMGDKRSYEETLALRAVATDDFMTADWARLPYDLLAKISARIVNEVAGINRVVYDITSKPPGTIEWE